MPKRTINSAPLPVAGSDSGDPVDRDPQASQSGNAGNGTEERPRSIGPYRILRRIDSGGMGVVYEGQRAGDEQTVAVKTVNRFQRRMLAALRAEVLALRRVQHLGVVRIIAEGLAEEHPWYSMELLRGKTLAQVHDECWPARRDRNRTLSTPVVTTGADADHEAELLSSGPAPTTASSGAIDKVASISLEALVDILSFYRRLCAPLAFIHAEGIVHRDLKPSNVMVRGDGTPVIMDFGLASRALGAGGREWLEFSGRFFGSVPYVAPEQIREEFVDARADLYALGCIMYEHLTGQPPFRAASTRSILDLHLSEPARAPSALSDGIPAAVDRLILRLLAKRPSERPGHASEVADELSEALHELGAGSVVDQEAVSAHVPTKVPSLYRPTLVGRGHILRDATATFQRARARQGTLLVINGESGIGKTYLAAELARQAAQQGLQVITGTCAPLSADPHGATSSNGSLHPFRHMFETLVDRCREGGKRAAEALFRGKANLFVDCEPSLASVADLGMDTKPPPLPPEASRHRLFTALAEVIGAMVADQPTLLILDDLQWADELSVSFLDWLPESFVSDKGLVLACIYRSDDAPDAVTNLGRRANVQLVQLTRLGATDVFSMVRDMLSVPQPPAALVRFVAERSEGNPFFVAEYLRLAAAQGIFSRRGGAWTMPGAAPHEALLEELPVPSSIQELVAERLIRLPAPLRTMVQMAAVLGREVDADLLLQLSAWTEAEVAEGLRELVTRQLFETTSAGTQRFAHHKTREVAYASIPEEKRAAWHLSAGRALEGRGERHQLLGALAYHLERGGDLVSATNYLEQAAQQTLGRFANHEAARAFQSLLSWGEAGSAGEAELRRGRWQRGLGDALHGLGRMEESRGHLVAATKLLGCPLPSSKVRQGLSLIGELGRQARWVFMRTNHDRERPLDHHALEGARAYDRLLQIAYYTGNPLDMFYATFRTLNLAERGGATPELGMAYAIAHAVAGIIPLRKVADFYLARAENALSRAYDPGVDSYLQLLAGVYRTGTAEWSRAHAAFERGLSLAEQSGFSRRCDELRLGLANWHFLQGSYAEAANQTEARGTVPLERGDLQAHAWQRLMRAQIDLVQGAFDEARLTAQTVQQHAGALQRSELIWLYAVLAAATERMGLTEEAHGYADRALDQITAGPPVTFYCIESYGLTAEVFLRLWATQRDRGGDVGDVGDLAHGARRACRALSKFAAIFPAARPRAALHAAALADLRGQARRAARLRLLSHRMAQTLALPPDAMMADWAIAQRGGAGEDAEQRLASALEASTRLRAWRAVDAIRGQGTSRGLEFGMFRPEPSTIEEKAP
ncbi:MAG: protein kinase [Myxococcales bacterium]